MVSGNRFPKTKSAFGRRRTENKCPIVELFSGLGLAALGLSRFWRRRLSGGAWGTAANDFLNHCMPVSCVDVLSMRRLPRGSSPTWNARSRQPGFARRRAVGARGRRRYRSWLSPLFLREAIPSARNRLSPALVACYQLATKLLPASIYLSIRYLSIKYSILVAW